MYKTVEIQRSTVSTCSLTLLAYKTDWKGSSYEWGCASFGKQVNIDNKHCCLHCCLRDVLIAEGYLTSAAGNLRTEQTVKVFQVS